MKKLEKMYQIGIIGSAGSDDYNGNQGATNNMMNEAEKIGCLLAKNNAIVVTGGKSGIMEAGARGAKKAGGQTVGVIKGVKRFTSNDFTDIEVISGMEGDGMDELLLVNMCDALIVIGGGAGTLQEITIAYRNNKPMVALTTQSGWAKELAGKFLDNRERVKIEIADSAESAVNKTLQLLSKK
ncbi:MAG: LOG family protein [Patescibacteria group bacterium]|nr:LOG family protein [Patescibacteria group bacterium]